MKKKVLRTKFKTQRATIKKLNEDNDQLKKQIWALTTRGDTHGTIHDSEVTDPRAPQEGTRRSIDRFDPQAYIAGKDKDGE